MIENAFERNRRVHNKYEPPPPQKNGFSLAEKHDYCFLLKKKIKRLYKHRVSTIVVTEHGLRFEFESKSF